MRLFVDVDETLIRFLPDTGPSMLAVTIEVNEHVVDWVKTWMDKHPGGGVTVWSDSGRDWAQNWAMQTIGKGFWGTAVKDFSRLTAGDVVIDDQPVRPLPVGATLWHPDELRVTQ